MYQFVDRPLESLDEGCRFTVWSMRAWVMAMSSRHCPARSLAPVFARWRMIGGLQPFHRTMLVLNREALETLAFHPLACPRVSEHEALILGLLSTLAKDGPIRVCDTLAMLVEEDAVGDLLETLSLLAAALAVAGLLPCEPEAAEERPRQA